MTDLHQTPGRRAPRSRPLEAAPATPAAAEPAAAPPTSSFSPGEPPPAPPAPPEEQGERPTGGVGIAVVVGLVALLGVTGGWSMLVVVASIVVIIFLHELGHYIAAKRSGMKVTEFFLGFGPRIWSFKKGETEYGLKAIPAGAYVKVIGMSNLEEVDPADESRTYRQKAFHKRLSVAVAGSAMHFLIAVVSLFLILSMYGLPGGRLDGDLSNLPWEVAAVTEGAGADEAGIVPGDRILSVDGVDVDGSFERFGAVVRGLPDETVPVVVERDGAEQVLDVTIGVGNPTATSDAQQAGFFGVGPQQIVEPSSVPESAVGAFREFGRAVGLTGQGLVSFFSPSGISDFAGQVTGGEPGPAVAGSGGGGEASGSGSGENRLISIVGAAQIGSDLTSAGLLAFLGFMVTINVSIGMINLIPLLPFDGGHVVIAAYEKLRSRKGREYRADISKMIPVTYAVLAVFLLFGLSAIYLDIVDPIDLGG